MLKNYKLGADQQGFASIVIALVLIIVLSLLTVGFAQLARREQQNSLDKQLANQAYYAAETGINDVYSAIYASSTSEANWLSAATGAPTNPNLGQIDPNTCLNSTQIAAITGNSSQGNEINSGTGTSYSCILLDLIPPDLTAHSTMGQATNIPFSSSDGGTLDSLTVSWQADSSPTHDSYSVGNSNLFLPYGSWAPNNSVGSNDRGAVLQFSLTPAPASGSVSSQGLTGSTYTAYLYPSSSAATCSGPINYCDYSSVMSDVTGTSEAPILDGGCTTSRADGRKYDCSVTITGLSASGYDVNIIPFYSNALVDINGTEGPSAAPTTAHFIGQTVIDVTGKARNVLKRIRVVTAPAASNAPPPVALETQNVCKREQTSPQTVNPFDGSTSPAFTDFVKPTGGLVAANDPCDLEN